MDEKAKKIAQQASIIMNLQTQVEDLSEKLSLALSQLSKLSIKKDSSNSSVPPSQDKGSKQRTKSLRKKSNKCTGGQPGHKGSNLKVVAIADRVVELKPSFCQKCGDSFTAEQLVYRSSRQVIDLPLPPVICTEFQQYKATCRCGHEQCGEYPQGVKANIQYGGYIEALVGYMSVYQYMPYKRMVEFLKDLFGVKLSEGTIANILKRLKDKGTPFYEQIREHIEHERKSVGSDESSCAVNGTNYWAWVWQTANLCYLTISPNRGKATVETHFPNGFPGAVLSSDRWAAHLNTSAKAHQICLAHLLRELNYLQESEEHPFATELHTLFRKAIKEKKKHLVFTQTDIIAETIEKQLDILLQQTIPKQDYPETAKLQKSLIKLRQTIFPFLYHKDVPADNNASERAIRNVKVKMKVSGQFKSGQDSFAVIRSIIDSLKKQGQNIFDALVDLANVEVYYSAC